ncbi:MAG: HipA domain-containing protein [Bacteroidaceae bacterium]|nr:HipA domain-containing protein [Bacteroidaceae bacterium]
MRIPVHNIENYSNGSELWVSGIPVIKRKNYFLEDKQIDGDAPKAFVGVYNHVLLGTKHKANRRNWIRYIAKTGHKWYPIESVTEQLLNRLGVVFGLGMAESRLAMIGGQLRFMSRYFLKPSREELVHGADILAGYFNDTLQFVEDIDRKKMTREFFTLQVIEDAVGSMFLYEKVDILKDLTKLVIYDALVGNNDRHFFNWGVIRSVDNSSRPYFSPVYDTARGLFWNYSEEKIRDVVEVNKTVDAHIKRYCKNSHPKIGWEGEKRLNHFQLFEKIYKNEFYITQSEIKELLLESVLDKMLSVVRTEFAPLMSENRVYMICRCLIHRFNIMNGLL